MVRWSIRIIVAVLCGAGVSALLFSTLPTGDAGGESSVTNTAKAQDSGNGATSTAALPNRDVYYPGSEDLKPDEMRVIACGTGMPNARPRQAAACWLVELGNGDKFLFDIGLGSAERIAAM